MKKLWIFDLDGTILDTLPTIADNVNTALRNFSYNTIPLEEYSAFLGMGPRYLISSVLDYLGKDELDLDKLMIKYLEVYYQNPIGSTVIFPGIEDFLRELKGREIKLACLSNKQDTTVQYLIDYFFPNTFDFVLGNTERIKSKPDPEMVDFALRDLGVDREEAIFVGDTEVDIQTGKNSGVGTIGVSWGFRSKEKLQEENPDYLIDHVRDLYKILEEA